MMVYVRRVICPGYFLRAVRAVYAYAVGRQSVTAGELLPVVAGAYREPLEWFSSAAVFAVVWRALLTAGGCASYGEFLGLCLREGRYI